jgi:hypothetical protein
MEETALVPIAPQIPETITTWSDYVAYYNELENLNVNLSWHKADLLLSLAEKFGDKSLEEFSYQIKEPRSTVVSYVRVARAFPPEKREGVVPFSVHLACSFVDSYDEKTKSFNGENRYQWLEKAIDENLSTRKINYEIQEEKLKKQVGVYRIMCDFCQKQNPPVRDYKFHALYSGQKPDTFKLHDDCYQTIIKTLKRPYGR